MKYLIIGLGNPGFEYKNTRHNIGFKFLDYFAKFYNEKFSSDRYADICEIKYKGKKMYLVKPNTFMNLSGKAVNYWITKLKIPIENMVVITDDISLPFQSIRLKSKGSDGGHNGLKDIISVLKTQNFPRLRIGIGNEFLKGKQSDFVLGKWNSEEDQIINERLKIILDLIWSFIVQGIDKTMNEYNNR
ncbi:MAG: aminoacyl-tRNA hydrolase [Flavobacteriales bacterium]|nr:aminoacyl-tRNA hydrolase [Flavobacteriales bacterium]|tara:strand:- start:1424 stop:1987 length:564 start_codon:yes stop_codon:yes gene_type:complete